MNIPQNLMYTQSHEWVKFTSETTAVVGLTDHAQDELGDIVYISLPEVGDEVTQGESVADVESVKAVSDIYSPFTGVVEKVNEDVTDSPELINQSAYDAWLMEIKDITDKETLLTAEEYEKFISEEA